MYWQWKMKMLYCRRISRTGMRPGSLEETLPINTAADEKTALSTIMVVDGAFFTCIFKAVDSLPFHTGVSNPDGRVKILKNDTHNVLIITAPEGVYRQMADLLARLDVSRAQVLVEAAIVELSADTALNLGVEWRGAWEEEGVVISGNTLGELPVPDGTSVSFTTEYGAVQALCQTTAGSCQVLWTSQEPRHSLSYAELTPTIDDRRCPTYPYFVNR